MLLEISPSYTEISSDCAYESLGYENDIVYIQKLVDTFIIQREVYKKTFNKKSGKFSVERINLIERHKNNTWRFLTGFLREITDILESFGYKDIYGNLRVQYTYNTVPDVSHILVNENPREYQTEGVIDALLQGRAVIESSVGSGKTLMMAMLLSALRKYKTLIIVPSLDLLKQIKTELTRLIPDYTVANINSPEFDYDVDVNALIGIPIHFRDVPDAVLQHYSVLCMDECHTSPAAIAKKVILHQNAPFRFGFTATTKGRSDGMDKIITGLFGKQISVINYKETVEQNFTPKINVKLHYSGWNSDFVLMEDMLIVHNKKRNDLIAKLAEEHLKQNKKGLVLILARRLDHIAELQEKYFPNAAVLTGETDERSSVIQDIKDGLYRVVLASNILSQGISIPHFTIGINASGGKSSILTEQRSGRMARGKVDIVKEWIDIFDDYYSTLEKHSVERIKVYSRVFGNVELVGFPDNKFNKIKQILSEKE